MKTIIIGTKSRAISQSKSKAIGSKIKNVGEINMAQHNLKILETYANAKLNGDKLFEIRDNTDRGFQKGDKVKYTAVDKLGCKVIHEINDKVYEITYVTNYAQKDGYVVFGEREVED